MVAPAYIEASVAAVRRQGLEVELIEQGGQWYAHVAAVQAKSPPWDKDAYPVLVAIPADETAALDAFYLGLPYSFSGGAHPRVGNAGTNLSLLGREWKLVSWHYADDRPWQPGRDDLASHLAHVRGFFLHRGARNDYR